MNIALNRFQCLVSIWSFECLQVLTMAKSDSSDSDFDEQEENDRKIS